MAADPQTPPPPDRGELIEGELIEASHPVPVDEQKRNGAGAAAVDAVFDVADRVLAPAVRFGWRTTSGIGRRLGVNRTIKSAADRAFDRAHWKRHGRADDRAGARERSRQPGLDKVLESEEAQELVERVAEAPEVRSAITSQGVGLLEDVRQAARRELRARLDDVARSQRRAGRCGVRSAPRGRPTPGRHPPARDRLRRGDPERDPAADLGPAGAAAQHGLLPRRRQQRPSRSPSG